MVVIITQKFVLIPTMFVTFRINFSDNQLKTQKSGHSIPKGFIGKGNLLIVQSQCRLYQSLWLSSCQFDK